MNLHQFTEAHNQLNSRLTQLIAQELHDFRRGTGVSVSSVAVQLFDVQAVGLPKEYLMGEVLTDVDLTTLSPADIHAGMAIKSMTSMSSTPTAQPAAQELPFGVGGGLVAIKTLLSRDPCAHATVAIGMIDAVLKERPAAKPATQEDWGPGLHEANSHPAADAQQAKEQEMGALSKELIQAGVSKFLAVELAKYSVNGPSAQTPARSEAANDYTPHGWPAWMTPVAPAKEGKS